MMRFWFAVALALLTGSVVQAQMWPFPGPGRAAIAGAAYVGPGDIVSGAYAWYGLRGYTAAYSTGSNPALDLVDQAGANPLTVNILANGRLDVASISTWVTANSVSTIKVKRWYDQSGNTRHMNQATLTNMPVLNLTGFGSLPAIVVSAASTQTMTTGASNGLSQPHTTSVVYLRNSSATNRELTSVFGGNPGMLVGTGQNTIQLNAGTGTTAVTSSDASWHAAQLIGNSTSSAIYVDGSGTTGLNAGTNTATSGNAINAAGAVFTNPFDGRYAEIGFWSGTGFNGTQAGNIDTNQHSAANGYNF